MHVQEIHRHSLILTRAGVSKRRPTIAPRPDVLEIVKMLTQQNSRRHILGNGKGQTSRSVGDTAGSCATTSSAQVALSVRESLKAVRRADRLLGAVGIRRRRVLEVLLPQLGCVARQKYRDFEWVVAIGMPEGDEVRRVFERPRRDKANITRGMSWEQRGLGFSAILLLNVEIRGGGCSGQMANSIQQKTNCVGLEPRMARRLCSARLRDPASADVSEREAAARVKQLGVSSVVQAV